MELSVLTPSPSNAEGIEDDNFIDFMRKLEADLVAEMIEQGVRMSWLTCLIPMN